MSGKTGCRGTPQERFAAKVKYGGGCWEWTGGKTPKGYGTFFEPKRLGYAHRFAYETEYGKISEGMCVLHKCDNPSCVRPDHLFLGTIADNNQDMARKGRSGQRKLTPEDAYAVLWRAVSGESQRKLAAEYGINRSTVQRIVYRKTWSSLSVSHD